MHFLAIARSYYLPVYWWLICSCFYPHCEYINTYCVCVVFKHYFVYNVMYVQEYEAAQSCVDRVLQMEPNSRQANQLKQLISKKIKRGGITYIINGHACTCT